MSEVKFDFIWKLFGEIFGLDGSWFREFFLVWFILFFVGERFGKKRFLCGCEVFCVWM